MKPEDFEELLANCADEPIRFPGAIQPHGVLLTLSEPGLNIIQVSANVGTLFGHAPEALLDQPLHRLIGEEYAQAVRTMAEDSAFLDSPPLLITSKVFDFSRTEITSPGFTCIEGMLQTSPLTVM